MAPANPLSIVLIKIASLQPNFSAAFPAAFSRLAFHHPPPRCVLSCWAGDGGSSTLGWGNWRGARCGQLDWKAILVD